MSLAAAIRDRDVAQLPGKRDEDWRWTDLRGLIRVLPEPSAGMVGEPEPGPFDGVADVRPMVVPNGGAARIEVAAGETQVVALRFVASGDGAHASEVAITVGEGGALHLFETYESDGASVAHAGLTFDLAPDAFVERVVLTFDHAEAVSVSRADVRLVGGDKSQFAQVVLASGARRQRIETHVAHPGHGANVNLDGIYLLAGKAHSDQTTVVAHQGVDGVTEQLAKGVVRDQARAVFQGRIVVAEGADRTDARMGHHALILSDRAEVDAKPELEIYADDVSCAHGNTVGALDEEALFYACQRGIPENEARAMLTEAFVGQVVERIRHAGAREIAAAWVAERLRS